MHLQAWSESSNAKRDSESISDETVTGDFDVRAESNHYRIQMVVRLPSSLHCHIFMTGARHTPKRTEGGRDVGMGGITFRWDWKVFRWD